MKRVVTIQDISCIGKCSLTVALPLLSTFNIETAIIPTAVLSTHTAFKNFTFRDLTDDIEPIMKVWEEDKFHFDGIYTGYLGSIKQIEIMKDFFHRFSSPDTLKIVDPCMGDFGKLYSGFDSSFALKMASLCQEADIILPNMTEASYLLGKECLKEGYREEDIKKLLVELSDLGCNKIILKGISFSQGSSSQEGVKNKIGICYYNREKDSYSWYFHKKIDGIFHGTGDIFASVLTGALVKNYSVEDAIKLAADFTLRAIEETVKDPERVFYGVNFETALCYLIERIKDKIY